MAVPSRLGLLELLKGTVGSQYVIPAYQRNYTWTTTHEVKQFLEDIKTVLKGERKKHFIGIVIYLEKALNPLKTERSVIDGQQRMTTTFLALYAIYELMVEHGMENEAKILEFNFLINQYSDNQKFKLKPLVSDDLVYQKIVNHETELFTNEDKLTNVYKNFYFIKQYFSELLGNFSFNEIMGAMDKLYLVCVPIEQDDYPQQIFESINATGAKLTASDLIRNYILMPIESDMQDAYYEKYWRKIENLVSQDSKKLEAFFRFFLMAKLQQVINKSAVYRAFVSWYEENKHSIGDEKILQTIVEYASYYNHIYVEDINSIEKPLQMPLQEFREIRTDMPIPLILELYSLTKQKNTTGHALVSINQMAEIITILNSYLMRRALAGMDTSDISRYFPTLLKDVLTDCDGKYEQLVRSFKKNLINRNRGNSQSMPDDKILADRVRYANMYSLRLWLLIFFRKLEMQNNSAPIDFSALSVEHLMPQTPTSDWLQALNVDKELYEQNLHRLGNLTLASRSDNSKMGNKVWGYKNQILASTAHLKMNIDVLSVEKWNIEAIEERTTTLINKMIELYPYYGDKSIEIESIPIHIVEDGANVDAIFYPDNGSVEIKEGSVLSTSFATAEKYTEVEGMRQDLLEDGVILQMGEELKFIQSYTIYPKRAKDTALSTAAQIVLHGTRNGWECWLLENGEPINNIRKKK